VPVSRINQKIAVSVVYVAAMFITLMDATIVNVALPTLGRQFGVAPDAVDTVAIGFLVSLAVFIPVSGWLGDRLGARRVLLGSVAAFTAASALCGQAHTLDELVIFRIVQGVAGGLMTPVGMAMLFRTFPVHERVRASSILTVPTAFAPAMGPVLGGLLVTDASWRWVFYVNVPIGALTVLFGLLFLAEQPTGPSGRLDLGGFVLSGVGFGALMYAVSEGPIHGWSRPTVLVTLFAGLALIGVMGVYEWRRPNPLLDLRLFKDRMFRGSTLVTLVSGMGFLGVLFVLALFYQDGLGFSALGAGLGTFPEAVGVMCSVQFVTRRLYRRIGPGPTMTAGLLAVTVLMGLLTMAGAGTNIWVLRAIVFLMGGSMALVFVPTQAIAFANLPPASTGGASTLYNALRQLGGALGVGVLTTVIAAVGPTHHHAGRIAPNLASYHAAFGVAAGFMLICAGLAWRVGRTDPTAVATDPAPQPRPPAGKVVTAPS
jgi:EmrB/QacA subfamily drug resistance transporter